MYSQSQKSNAFQIALSRTLQKFGITKEGLESFRNLGIADYPQIVNQSFNKIFIIHSFK